MVTFFDSKKVKENRDYIKGLVALAKIDNKIAKSEIECIYKIGEKKGLSRTDIYDIIRENYTGKLIVPDTIEERFEMLYDMIDVMLADGIIDDQEMDFCVDLAEKLGVRAATCGVLVTKMTTAMQTGVKKEKLYKEATPFLV